jgi:hypothetical protein
LRHIAGDDLSTLGETMLRAICKKKSDDGHDPLGALLRSYSSEVAREKLRAAMIHGFVEPLAARLSGPNARERAELVGSTLLGVLVYRAIAGTLSDEEREQMVTSSAPYVQGIIDGLPSRNVAKG